MKALYLAILAMFILSIAAVNAATYNLSPSDDAYVSSAQPTTNFGSDDTLITKQGGGCATEWRSFLQFNTTGFNSANLTNVTVVMTFNNASGECVGFSTVFLRNLLTNFTEGVVTWNNQPSFDATQHSRQAANGAVSEKDRWTSTTLFNFVNGSIGGIVDLGFYTTGGSQLWGSKEASANFRPYLELIYNGTTGGGGNLTSPAQINSVSFPAVVNIGDTVSTSVSFTNTGNFTARYKVGFSIGNSTIGFCNTNCYVGGNSAVDPDTSTVWYAIVTVAPDHTAVVSTPFRFRSDFFTAGNYYQLLVTIRPEHTFDILDNLTINNAVLVVPNNTVAPAGAIAKILNISVSDTRPTRTQEITAKILVTNNGTEAGNFFVGFSIGKAETGFCNRNCYNDCNGVIGVGCDYGQTGLIHVNQSVVVTRRFFIDPFFFEDGKTYDVTSGVYNAPYLSPSQALHYVTLPDYINVTTFINKLNTYAIYATAKPDKVQIRNVTALAEDTMTVDFAVFNNNSLLYNYTIGISIGKWDAVNKQVYRESQAAIAPACDIHCYTNSEQFFFRIIPANLTAPLSKQFRVAGFFLENNSYDVAIAVYAGTQEGNRELVTIVYFKDAFQVILPPAKPISIGNTGSEVVGKIFGVDIETAKMFLAVFISLLLGALIGYWTKDGLVTVVVIELLLVMFTMASWIPIIFLIVEGLIAAFLIANFVRKVFSGHQQ